MVVGEVFLGAFLSLLVQKLTSPELEEFAERWKVEENLKKLERTLKKIQKVINDAEEQQIKKPAVKDWLEELKYVAYDIEDILDQFSTEALRLQSQTSTMQVHHKLIPSSWCVDSFLFGVGSKINKINKKLKRIAIERDDLGLREEVGDVPSPVTQIPQTSSLLNKSDVYGRENDKEEIIKLLLSNEPSHNVVGVIPIHGMGGIGKTTLAQLVYNDERVNQNFGLKAWANVSGNFDTLKLTKAILESAHRHSYNLNELDSLQVELKNIVTKKKFLLVLDDVWDVKYNDWYLLLTPFQYGTEGSKIIVTTPNNTIASTLGVAAHQLDGLSEEDCLSLFKHHAFIEGTTNGNPNLEAIGKEIVKKCKGLPLAAKTLGGLLRSTPNENEWERKNEWERIMKSEIWDLPEYEAGILPALRLSYHHLPPHLKRCFAFCSIFPNGYEFEKEKLVLLWMGEGLVPSKERRQMEDTGGEYFDELFNRSFLQRSSRNRSMFVMHDLMNDLAQSVSREICVRLEGSVVDFRLEKARHLSYVRGRYDSIAKFKAFYKAKYLRTFLPLTQQFTQGEHYYSYLPKEVLHGLFSKLRCLRVLCLSWHYVTELPDSISNLKILRYLDLSHTPIKRLPDSIGSLCSLQTLILIGCYYLRELPNDMGNLINLRHLEIDWLKKMPLCIGRLTSLQKLSKFVVGKSSSGSSIRDLKRMLHIGGNLCLPNLENVENVTDIVEADLKNKKRLHGLELEWSNERGYSTMGDEDVLDGLQPHLNLKELTIKWYRGYRLSNWIGDPMSLSNLVTLRLIDCQHLRSLPPIEKLPCLKSLIIRGMHGIDTLGHELSGDGVVEPFPKLEIITFENMRKLGEWYGGVFPCLRVLRILDCPRLRKIKPCFPKLLKLEIYGCEDMVTLPNLGKEDIHPSSSSYLGIFNKYITKNRKEKLNEQEDVSIGGYCREIIIKNCPSLAKLPPFFPTLEKLEIHECGKLNALPMLPSLNKLDLEGCDETILTRVVELTSLSSLRISRVSRLIRLTDGFLRALTALVDLEISKCRELKFLGDQIGLQHLVSLHRLVILECPQLVSLPQENKLPVSLQYLSLSHCYALKELPQLNLLTELRSLSITECDKLNCLPQGLDNLTSLEHLEIRVCSGIKSFPETGLPIMLQRLDIIECQNLKFLPEYLYNHKSLNNLNIAGCSSLVSFPRGGLPTTLKNLELNDCPNLESLPEGLHTLASLERFEINKCPHLESFPEGGSPITTTITLKSISISQCQNLKSLSEWTHHHTSIQELRIHGCPNLISFPEKGLPINLQSLSIKYCENLKLLPQWGLQNLTSLRDLTIGECPCLESSLECLLLPTTLSYLCFESCQHLESLPKGLQNLTSLDELKIIHCPRLASLPKLGLPTMLSRLVIRDCPLLKQRCEKKKGKDWPKIDCIPCLLID